MTMEDLRAGRAYMLGTHFCFPPVYVKVGRRAWSPTHDICRATPFDSEESARKNLVRNAAAIRFLESLDDATRHRIKPLRVDLKIGPA